MQTDRTEGLRTFTLTIKGEPFEADRALSDRDFGGDHAPILATSRLCGSPAERMTLRP